MALNGKVLLGLIAILIASLGSASAGDDTSIEVELNRQFKSKSLTFRNPFHATGLTFDAAGKYVGAAEPGTWAGDATFLISKVRVKTHGLEFEGRPLAMYYDENGNRKFAVRPGNIHVTLGIDGPVERSAIQLAMEKVFLTDKDPPPYLPPPTFDHLSGGYEKKPGSDEMYRLKGTSEWRKTKEIQEPIEVGESEGGEKIYVVAGPVTLPKALATKDPEYPEQERAAKHAGKVVLSVVVDSAGRVASMRVEKATSATFAALTAAAVAQWRFQPGTMIDKPVPVLIKVETNFRLY
jgi:TonB family protein